MTDLPAAMLAFAAVGANVLAVGMHLLLNPTSRVARWFVAWTAVWIVVLLAQGMSLLPASSPRWDWLFTRAVLVLPVVFLAFATVLARHWSALAGACLVACWIVVIWLAHADFDTRGWIGVVWYAAWVCGIAVLWGCTKRERLPVRGGYFPRRLFVATLFLFGPITVVASVLGGRWYGLYAAPVLSVVLQFVIFYGVIRLRFYDWETDAERRGDLAARAAETERLAVVGELAASLAHEVRNPLTGIRSLAQRIAEEDVDEDRRRRYAEIIIREIERIEQIVTSLLHLARGASAPSEAPAPTDLADIFADLELLTRKRAEESGISVTVDAEGTTADVPRDALAQALLNLLLNALSQTPRGGEVALRARRNGAGVDVVVRDGGPGIPESDRDKIFDAFYSADGGTGLGLAVVRRLVREHGWRLVIDDHPGGGAEFRLQLTP